MNMKETIMFRNQIWKWVFFSLLCIFSGCGKEDVPLEVINPDDYIPYVKEGKIWVYNSLKDGNGHYTYEMISGDTMIMGRQYKKVMGWSMGNNNKSYLGAIREENKMTYCVNRGQTSEELQFDFGQKGDQFISMRYPYALITILSIDTLEYSRRKFRRFNCDNEIIDSDYHYHWKWFYIEGIGEGTWNFPPDFDTKDCVYHLIRCEDNGEVIFDWSDAVGWNVVSNQ